MTVKRRSREEWSEVVAQFERSGLSQKAFAKKKGIKRTTLSWWAWEIRREASESQQPAFVPVQVRAGEEEIQQGPGDDGRAAVVRLGRVELSLSAEADPGWVAAVMAELTRC